MKDVSDDKFTIFEIYKNVYVYKNMFKDIEQTFQLIKDSADNSDNNFLNKWSPWATFGEYLLPATNKLPKNVPYDQHAKYGNMQFAIAETDLQQKQKDAVLEICDVFYTATKDYAIKHGINIDQETMVDAYFGGKVSLWAPQAPVICKYDIAKDYDEVTMSYHTDYRREDSGKPDYKFVITALAYFNDDYEGGEIDFLINKKLLKYKPVAGDFLIFPSGHPDYLTEDGMVYLHGVLPSKKTHKYFARMFWQKYYEGSQEWLDGEKKYGRAKWLEMQPDIEQEYRLSHPNKHNFEDKVRIN